MTTPRYNHLISLNEHDEDVLIKCMKKSNSNITETIRRALNQYIKSDEE